jgi:hypothetical protein
MKLKLLLIVLLTILLSILLPSNAAVHHWDNGTNAYWAGTKPVQLVIDTEFPQEVVNRVFEILEPYPFVLKERGDIDISYNPAVNEIAVAFLPQYINGGGAFLDKAYRLPDGGVNRGLCLAGTASDTERLAWIIIHEICHSLGLDHIQPFRAGEGSPRPRGLMTSVQPNFGFLHDDLRALSETLREEFLDDTVTVSGTIPALEGMVLNFVNVDNPKHSSQIVPSYSFEEKTEYEIKRLKKGRYYINATPITNKAVIVNTAPKPSTYSKIRYFRGKRIIKINRDRILNLKF